MLGRAFYRHWGVLVTSKPPLSIDQFDPEHLPIFLYTSQLDRMHEFFFLVFWFRSSKF